ncbi:hypothetical protein SAMN05444006_112118 [Allgaiera indica]|uniref:Uncharacterized protein n=1 Tax=Allgaiera indica TaxID=765699 RepID=A0A1H3A9F1_9RHOB|nr:hypothetical protein SAMN05444006_112118 [Allgaiera indica]
MVPFSVLPETSKTRPALQPAYPVFDRRSDIAVKIVKKCQIRRPKRRVPGRMQPNRPSRKQAPVQPVQQRASPGASPHATQNCAPRNHHHPKGIPRRSAAPPRTRWSRHDRFGAKQRIGFGPADQPPRPALGRNARPVRPCAALSAPKPGNSRGCGDWPRRRARGGGPARTRNQGPRAGDPAAVAVSRCPRPRHAASSRRRVQTSSFAISASLVTEFRLRAVPVSMPASQSRERPMPEG